MIRFRQGKENLTLLILEGRASEQTGIPESQSLLEKMFDSIVDLFSLPT
jgi:hypothetical protein